MTDSTGPTTIAPRPWRRHGVFVSDCEQTLANMFIVRDAKNRFVGAFDRVADAVVCADAVNFADKQQVPQLDLDPRELGTVLAALRYWQSDLSDNLADLDGCLLDGSGIATDGGTLEPLTPDEIDALCERLNTSPDPLAIPSAADLRKSRLADAGEDMLAALEAMVRKYASADDGYPGDTPAHLARAAIAKAKGEATEAPAAQLAPQTVWALVIDHKHGTDVTVHRTREDAIANGAAYARSWWDDVQSDGDKAPDPDEEAFELYFQRQAETGDEWYRLEECEL